MVIKEKSDLLEAHLEKRTVRLQHGLAAKKRALHKVLTACSPLSCSSHALLCYSRRMRSCHHLLLCHAHHNRSFLVLSISLLIDTMMVLKATIVYRSFGPQLRMGK